MAPTMLKTAVGYIALAILASFLILPTVKSRVTGTDHSEPCSARSRRYAKKEEVQEKRSETSKTIKVKRILLKKAVKNGAVCLDGSPPGYHFRKGW